LVKPPRVLNTLSVVEIGRNGGLRPPKFRVQPPSGMPEIASTPMVHRNRLQSRAEFWMIAVHDAASSRSSHRSAGKDSREK
jgi:hypothetical protein